MIHEKIEKHVHYTCDFCGKVCEPVRNITHPHGFMQDGDRKEFVIGVSGVLCHRDPIRMKRARTMLEDVCSECALPVLEAVTESLRQKVEGNANSASESTATDA